MVAKMMTNMMVERMRKLTKTMKMMRTNTVKTKMNTMRRSGESRNCG